MKIAYHKRLTRVALVLFIVNLHTYSALAQQITYSEPEREDSRRTNFEIIGRIGGHTLVFKNNRSDNAISVYDDDMKLVERVPLNYMDDRYINVDFVPYGNFCWMIYQYQKKSIVYCMGVRINGNGKQMTDPIQLDTTRIGWAANNKIYTTIFSEDKKQIMIFKINSHNPKNFVFTTLLFDDSLRLEHKHQMNLSMEERNDFFTDFYLDDKGNLVFGKFRRKSGNDYISALSLVVKPANIPVFQLHLLNGEERLLDEIKIKVDNSTERYLVNALYYKQKRGNIEGLYTAIWDAPADTLEKASFTAFNDDLRRQAKGPDANLKYAFDDYYIQDVIAKKDSGYVLIGESLYNTSRGSTFNRWDYYSWNNPWSSPMDYYYWSPYYSPWRYPWGSWGGGQNTRYHADNILILSFDKNNDLEWSNVIPKSQFDDESDALISFHLMNTGGALHFLFNEYERRALLLNDQSLGADGKVTRLPTLKNLDRGYEFMARYGKQISAHSIVMPCLYRNYLCFAKIDF